MITTAFYQESNSIKSLQRSSQSHNHSLQNSDIPTLLGTRVKSSCNTEIGTKRFKPNTSGPRTRISFDGAEEAFKSNSSGPSKPNNSTNNYTNEKIPCKDHQNHGSNTIHPDEMQNPTQAGVSTTTEEEDSEEEHSKPFGGSKHSCLFNNPSLYGDSRSSECTSLTSPIASPQPATLQCPEMVRNLSLDHEESTDTRPATDEPCTRILCNFISRL